MNKNIKYCQSGTALLMTLLILNIVIMISLASAKIIFSGIKMGNTQARSAKAYFAAESGMEKTLWTWRKNGWDIRAVPPGTSNIFSGSLPNGSSYRVDRATTAEVILRSTGENDNLRRTVEIQLDF
jgi:type II secretory pathway component PulK